MEASLPVSAEINPVRERSSRAPRASVHAPSVSLPLRFTALGLAAFLFGLSWLIFQPVVLSIYHYTPAAVAVTHLFVLGWIISCVIGAMYQLVPVALETELYSERLARWHFVIHFIGFAGMVWMFRAWDMKQVGHFASVFALGLGLFVYNIARTLLRVSKWNVVASAIAASLFWISSTAFAGLSIVAGKCTYELVGKYTDASVLGALLHGLRAMGVFMSHFAPLGAMHAHAHLGVVGFILMLLVGVSYKLIPMFTLSEIQSSGRAILSVLLLNIGLAGSFVAILLQSQWKPLFAVVIVAALVSYGFEIAAMLRARKRLPLDWGIRYFLTAVCLLAPVCTIGLFLSRPVMVWTDLNGQLENLYGFLALIGVVSFAIMGMLYKIVPFLVWFGSYGRHIGRARVPALAEMYSPRLQAIGYWAFLAGLIATSAAILLKSEIGVRGGSLLLAASLIAFTLNMGFIASHISRPRLSPLKPACASK